MTRTLLFLLGLVPCVLCQGQMKVTVNVVDRLSGVDNVEVVGDSIMFPADQEYEIGAGALVDIQTDKKYISLFVLSNGKSVPYTTVKEVEGEGKTIFLKDPGTYTVLVTAFDPGLDQGTTLVEVPRGSGPVVPLPDDIPEPSDKLKALVKPVLDKLSQDKDKAFLVSQTFQGFAEAIEVLNPGTIENFRKINTLATQSLNLRVGVSIGAEVDNMITDYLNLKKGEDGFWISREMTAEDQKKVSEIFRAIAWAGRQ